MTLNFFIFKISSSFKFKKTFGRGQHIGVSVVHSLHSSARQQTVQFIQTDRFSVARYVGTCLHRAKQRPDGQLPYPTRLRLLDSNKLCTNYSVVKANMMTYPGIRFFNVP